MVADDKSLRQKLRGSEAARLPTTDEGCGESMSGRWDAKSVEPATYVALAPAMVREGQEVGDNSNSAKVSTRTFLGSSVRRSTS